MGQLVDPCVLSRPQPSRRPVGFLDEHRSIEYSRRAIDIGAIATPRSSVATPWRFTTPGGRHIPRVPLIVITVVGISAAAAGTPARVQMPPGPLGRQDPTVEDNTLGKLKNQPIGTHTLDALNLPDEFLRRVADRVIRLAFQNRSRRVVRDETTPLPPNTPATDTAQSTPLATATAPTLMPWWAYTIALCCLIAAIVGVALVVKRRKRMA